MARKDRRKPMLRMIAAEWTMRGYPTSRREWSMERKVKAAKEAGFIGLSAPADAEVVSALHKHKMIHVGNVDMATEGEAVSRLRKFQEAGAVHINVQLCDHDTPVEISLPVARKVMVVGEALGLKPAIEVHRDTCTETPEKTFALAEAYEKRYKKKLRMNFDHSHPAIIKQLRPPDYWTRLSERPDLFLRSELIHLRPFTGSHCQTPVTNGKGRLDGDFKTWLDNFCEPALTAWLKGAERGKELFAVVELGPKGSGYGLAIFPDIWKDAIRARKEISRLFRRGVRDWKP